MPATSRGAGVDEAVVEEVVLDWLAELGYQRGCGEDDGLAEGQTERTNPEEVVLLKRLRDAAIRINPQVPKEAIEEGIRKITRAESPSLPDLNHSFHYQLVNGVNVEYFREDGSIAGDLVRLVDFDNVDNNDWLALNQFTVTENGYNRRADVIVFVNGLPLGLMELKNPVSEHAKLGNAFNQLQTYKHQVPSLFHYNEVLVISDGMRARIGTLTANRERFMPWRRLDDNEPSRELELEVLVKDIFEKSRFLDLIRHFVVFDSDGSDVVKKMAGYHQYHAVQKAVSSTVAAAGPEGDRRVGVVWHTQGSGKSLTMAFYAGKVVLEPAMANPTLLVITDRNDLDDQLFGTFARCHELLRQEPVQAADRKQLRELLQVGSGGVIFTTVHKFFPDSKGDAYPLLSDRRNIVVIADEAHRSQYDFIDGFARHMRDALPNASFIGFTGTPIELSDKNTRAVFGDYISIYDIQRAVEDKATVPIYYESRLAKLELDELERPHLDQGFEEVTEGEEQKAKERLKTKWAALEAVVGAQKRLSLVASDMLSHFEARLEVMDGKAMIVCMSRRICIALYESIVALRPEWHSDEDGDGAIKVVMTGSASDPLVWQAHIRTKNRREALAKRFKDPADALKVVIVRDMWLTGFDAPCLHTMYIDKPMRGHGLMQAIARVNRVFGDKPGGLVVDYLGIAHELKQALADYTASGGRGKTAIDKGEAVAVMLEKYEVCRELFYGFDWSDWISGTADRRLKLLPLAQEHILSQANGKKRLVDAVAELGKAFALAVPDEDSVRIRDDVDFFQKVRNALVKTTSLRSRTKGDVDHAMRQLLSRAVASDEVVDVFTAAGLKRPSGNILSEEFLSEVRASPHRNLAAEVLERLLRGEIKVRTRKFLVQSRSFSDMLETSIRRYHNRALQAGEVIEELLQLAREMRDADQRGEQLRLSEDELAFYDALEVNDSAVQVLGDENLRKIAQELVQAVRSSTAIDWTVRETVRAKMRVMVRRILRKYGYPPDKQAKATQTVLEQAELLCANWAQ